MMDKEYVQKQVEKFMRIFEIIGWFMLISSIPFWYMTHMPLSTIVLVVLSAVWIIGVRIDRKRIMGSE